MSHLAPLISDLALILICAGIMTLVFKKLKQPLVLGYIVAGFLASPHFTFTPSVTDAESIKTWSDIGVIFLLFALGLDFSFKKLMKVGGSAVISACTIILCMIAVGIFVGWTFGWKQMDCIYLGGMLAMSSTTIIYKAFDDLGIRQQVKPSQTGKFSTSYVPALTKYTTKSITFFHSSCRKIGASRLALTISANTPFPLT